MRNSVRSNVSLGTLLAAGLLVALVPAAMAGIVVTTSTDGDAIPGGTVTVTAGLCATAGESINSIDSITWTQTAGIPATLSGTDTATVTAVLADSATFKAHLVEALTEPLITPDDLPPNVEYPAEGTFGGLQPRWGVVGVNPHSYAEAMDVIVKATIVATVDGVQATYTSSPVVGVGPWLPSTGLLTVPVGTAVLMNGKDQATYDWAMTAPSASTATLMDATERYPYFTPDVVGTYALTVTDAAAGEARTLTLYAGTWKGAIVGQDANGRPVSDTSCTICHNGAIAGDQFATWAQSGHAEIFTNSLNVAPPATHYSPNCFSCHTVGYLPDAVNGGIDDVASYTEWKDHYFHVDECGAVHPETDPNTWTETLANYPAVARLGNVQCESCHGPQDAGSAHFPMNPVGTPRVTLSSDVCASCHGEPARHGRFQQWQLSPHANYELVLEEAENNNCGRCHSANGFIAWVPALTDDDPSNDLANVTVTWTAEEAHPQTCQTCHDPHDVGTTSGNDATNATVRISGDTAMTTSGFIATDVGTGAICITCHTSRRGLQNDDTYTASNKTRSPHLGSQSDILMGQNAFFVEPDQRGYHSLLENTCVDCHMENTDPPADFSYNFGGTNHTFYASQDICADCHSVVDYAAVAEPVHDGLEELAMAIEGAYHDIIAQALASGATVDFDGTATIDDLADFTAITLGESHGRQAIGLVLADGAEIAVVSINAIDVIPAEGDAFTLEALVPDRLGKAYWNFLLVELDGSMGVHNPKYVMDILTASAEEVHAIGGGIGEGDETGPGVACASPFTYWTELAAHNPGSFGTTWRTDVVGQNMGEDTATIQFILHTSTGLVTMDSAIEGGKQGVYEDLLALMGVDNDKGALEICSDQPLAFVARIYNQAEEGTFGQFMNGLTYYLGLREGDTARLLGLRQMTDLFRTNISVTNTGLEAATVTIALYGTDGTMLTSYELAVEPGVVKQDIEPFRTRANAATIGWGYATVTVESGNGILTSASVVDSVTGDATTIPMKN